MTIIISQFVSDVVSFQHVAAKSIQTCGQFAKGKLATTMKSWFYHTVNGYVAELWLEEVGSKWDRAWKLSLAAKCIKYSKDPLDIFTIVSVWFTGEIYRGINRTDKPLSTILWGRISTYAEDFGNTIIEDKTYYMQNNSRMEKDRIG